MFQHKSSQRNLLSMIENVPRAPNINVCTRVWVAVMIAMLRRHVVILATEAH